MIAIGIKITGHDTGVGVIIKKNEKYKIYNFLEERFNRDKNTYKFPINSISKALKITGVKSFYDADIVLCEYSSLDGVEEKQKLIKNGYDLKNFKNIQFISHHICHASNVFLFSNKQKAIILVQDAKGTRKKNEYKKENFIKKLYYKFYLNNQIRERKIKFAEGLTIFKAQKNPFKIDISYQKYVTGSKNFGPKNADIPYVLARYYCGFGQFGAGKVMGLASYVKSNTRKYLLNNLIIKNNFDLDFSKMYKKFYKFRLIKSKNKIFNNVESIIKSNEAKIASEAQTVLEEAMVYYANQIKNKYPDYNNLCISGGSALNLSSNREVYNTGLFNNVFVAPSSDDSGIALGAAIYGMFNKLNQNTGSEKFFASYLGEEHNFNKLSKNLSTKGKIFNNDLELINTIVSLLLKGNIIGFCIGRSENGPRALGHRSIMCLPNKNSQKDRVNKKIKKENGGDLFHQYV